MNDLSPLVSGRRLEESLGNIVTGQRRDFPARVLWGLLRGASHLYGLGVRGNLALYRWGMIPRTQLPCWVVSVGNLTLGGTGKTSGALWLARQYRAQGQRVAILSRGHGRGSQEAVGVVADGQKVLMEAEEAGDEPFLLAQALKGVPVLVGKNRVLTGRYALEHWDPEVLILDDGFQYWRLKKDVEIVLIDATDPFGPGSLFPAGTLREPLSHLNRADLIWITRCECVESTEVTALEQQLRRLYPTLPILRTSHKPVYLRPHNASDFHPPTLLQGRCVGALSSIGNPSAFEHSLRHLGVATLAPARFPDHHPYRLEELRKVAAAAQKQGLEWIVTTEKDAIRFPPEWSPRLPVWVLGIDMALSLDDSLKAKLRLENPETVTPEFEAR